MRFRVIFYVPKFGVRERLSGEKALPLCERLRTSDLVSLVPNSLREMRSTAAVSPETH